MSRLRPRVITLSGLALLVACGGQAIEQLTSGQQAGESPFDAVCEAGIVSLDAAKPDAAPAAPHDAGPPADGGVCARLRFPLFPGPIQDITKTPILYNHRENWTLFGDSLLAEVGEPYFGDAGSGAPNAVAMAEYLRRKMGTDVQFKNVSHGGWTSAQIRAGIPSASTWAWETKAVNVAVVESSGVNDCAQARASCTPAKVDAILTNVFGACDDLRALGWKVVLLSPIMSMVYAVPDGTTPGWDHYLDRERAEWPQHADLWIDASSDRMINRDRMVYDGGYRMDGYRLWGYLDDHHLNGNGCEAWSQDIVCPAADFAQSLLTDGGVLGSPYCNEAYYGEACCTPGVDPGCN